MRSYVLKYVAQFQVCLSQETSISYPVGFMGKEKHVSFPWQAIALDLIGRLPTSFREYLYCRIHGLVYKFTLLFP